MDTQEPLEDARTRVFLSYSRRDSALVARVAEGLLAAGFLADYDQAAHDPGNVSAGISAEDEWWKRLQEMIAAADVMVFLVSPDSSASAVCDEEIAYARALGKRIIAVLARPVDFAKAPPRLAALNVRIDFSEAGPGFDAALAALVSALEMNVVWHRDGRKYYARVQEWDTAGRPKSRLLREGAVEEAERWAVARPRNEPEPGELFLAWIAASRAQIKADAARRAFWRRVTAVFVLTTLLATVAGAWFVVNGQRNLGRSESLMLARTADQFHNQGDYLQALHLSILASRDRFLAPSTDEAKAAFAKSAQAMRLTAALEITGEDDIETVHSLAGGKRLLVQTATGAVELWDVASKTRVAGPLRPDETGGLTTFLLSGDTRLALMHGSSSLLGLDTVTGATFGPLKGEGSPAKPMTPMAVSRDGARFLTLDSQIGLGLRDGKTGEKIAQLGQGPGWALRTDFSDDGRTVLAANEMEVALFRADTGARIGASQAIKGETVSDVFLSPDGTRAVVSVQNERAYYFAIAGSQIDLLGTLANEIVYGAYFYPNSDRLVTLDGSGNVQVRTMASGTPLGQAAPDSPGFTDAFVSEAQGLVLTSSLLSGIRLTRLADGEMIHQLEDTSYTRALLAPDQPGFYAWNGRNVIFQGAHPDSEPESLVMEHPGFVEDVAVSADGAQLITFSAESEARIWDSKSGVPAGGVYPHANYSARQGFVGASNTFMTVVGKRIFLWQAGPSVRIARPQIDDGQLDNSLLSPDGRFVMAWTQSGRAVLWDVAADKAIGPGILTGEQGYWGAAFDPGAGQLALWFENTIQIIDTATGTGRETLFESSDVVTSGAFTQDGERFVSLDTAGQVRIWDTARMAPLGEPMAHEGFGSSLVVDAVRGRMITWTGATARLIDLQTGQRIGAEMEHVWHGGGDETSVLVLGAAFSGNGEVAATWNADELRLWDAASGAGRGEPILPAETINAAVFSEDGRRVMLVMQSKVEVLDTATGERVLKALSVRRPVWGGSLSADGSMAATFTDDSMIRLWRVETGAPIGNAVQTGLIEQAGAFTPDGRRLLVTEPTGAFRIIDTATGDVVSLLDQYAFAGGAVWKPEDGALLTHTYDGEVRRWDISGALRLDAGKDDIAAVCAARLAGADFVRRLDQKATFAAPILRGREGEDVCAAPRTPWWETAAGLVFGWAFG